MQQKIQLQNLFTGQAYEGHTIFTVMTQKI